MSDVEGIMQELKQRIRHVPDFPKPGILFYDVTTLLKDPVGFRLSVDAMAEPYADEQIDLIVGIESRGFIFGSAVADRLSTGFAPVRKLGKLPSTTRRATYALEYGTDTLEIHDDAVTKGQRVLVMDDLLATGGTAAATVGLVRALGGDVVGVQFLIELVALNGRERLAGERIGTVLQY
jgi:adenine phosphoribosyltransferase